jgi:DNA-binding transcriptional LysR family regulator
LPSNASRTKEANAGRSAFTKYHQAATSQRRTHPATLIARKLGSTHRLLCASPDYLARYGAPDVPADLARHDCVIAGQSADAQWLLEGPHGQETVTVSGRFAANEMQAVMAAAIAGYGIAQLPHGVADVCIKDGRCAAFSTATRRRPAACMSSIPAASTCRRWSRHSSRWRPSA